jgi:4-amino-4-deoxy-L-arabinose transferase-like glycosyltransferase
VEKKREEGMSPLVQGLALGIGVGLATALGLLCLGTLVCLKLEVETEPVVICFLSALLGGLVGACRAGRCKLPVALGVALGLTVLWLLLGAAQEGELELSALCSHGISGVLGGGMAGLLASRRKKSRK